jgi:hypothetical protein
LEHSDLRFTVVGFNILTGDIGAEFLIAVFLAVEDQADLCSWCSSTELFFDPCRHYFETVFIAGAFALRDVLAVRPFLAIARATRVTLLITFALDNGEALTVRTGAISYEH